MGCFGLDALGKGPRGAPANLSFPKNVACRLRQNSGKSCITLPYHCWFHREYGMVVLPYGGCHTTILIPASCWPEIVHLQQQTEGMLKHYNYLRDRDAVLRKCVTVQVNTS